MSACVLRSGDPLMKTLFFLLLEPHAVGAIPQVGYPVDAVLPSRRIASHGGLLACTVTARHSLHLFGDLSIAAACILLDVVGTLGPGGRRWCAHLANHVASASLCWYFLLGGHVGPCWPPACHLLIYQHPFPGPPNVF